MEENQRGGPGGGLPPGAWAAALFLAICVLASIYFVVFTVCQAVLF